MHDLFYHIKRQAYLTSKQAQIIEGVRDAIIEGDLVAGNVLPSVNRLIQRLGYSRMTIVHALNRLKELNLIESKDKVGYFVRSNVSPNKQRIFLFLAEFNLYHEILYNTLKSSLAHLPITIDLFIHHFNPISFRTILRENLGKYDQYIVSTFDHKVVAEELKRVPNKKLLQIMRQPVIEGSAIYQDFSSTFEEELTTLLSRLSSYLRFIALCPADSKHPGETIDAFRHFCQLHNIEHEVWNTIPEGDIPPGTVFLTLRDHSLVNLIRKADQAALQIGKDYGVISYNDTAFKEIIHGGITVLTVDFEEMGRRIANFVLERKPVEICMKPTIILRNSL